MHIRLLTWMQVYNYLFMSVLHSLLAALCTSEVFKIEKYGQHVTSEYLETSYPTFLNVIQNDDIVISQL